MKKEVVYPSLDTPSVLIDLDKVEANIRTMSQAVADSGLKLRPHVKVHSSAEIAKMQIKAGACGIEVGSVDQALCMADEGLIDIIVAHPFCGSHKMKTFKILFERPNLKIGCVIDSIEHAVVLAQVGQAVGKKVPILIKIAFPGYAPRFGLTSSEEVLRMANQLRQLSGVELVGVYGHEMGAKPTQDGVDEAAFKCATIISNMAKELKNEGIVLQHVSVGASNTYLSTCRYIKEGKFPEITEIHPGQCVVGDIMYMRGHATTLDMCAVTVLVTVVSTVHSEWAMINSGYKTLGAESIINSYQTPGFFWNDKPSYGVIAGRTDLWLGRLSAESANVYYRDPHKKLKLGERLQIIPNNSTLVINIHDIIYGVRKGQVEKKIAVTGRKRGI